MTPRTTTLTAALVVSFSTAATIFACAGRAESDQTAIEPETEAETATETEQGSLATRCPEAFPEDGSSCERYPTGLVCEYEFCDGLGRSASCAPVILSRDEGRWEYQWSVDEPLCVPLPELAAGCPASLPAAGADCEGEGLTCNYRTECAGYSDPDVALCQFGQWVLQYPPRATCDPVIEPPLCPQREIVAGSGCAYERQRCSAEVCQPGVAERAGYECLDGSWQAASLSCLPED